MVLNYEVGSRIFGSSRILIPPLTLTHNTHGAHTTHTELTQRHKHTNTKAKKATNKLKTNSKTNQKQIKNQINRHGKFIKKKKQF